LNQNSFIKLNRRNTFLRLQCLISLVSNGHHSSNYRSVLLKVPIYLIVYLKTNDWRNDKKKQHQDVNVLKKNIGRLNHLKKRYGK